MKNRLIVVGLAASVCVIALLGVAVALSISGTTNRQPVRVVHASTHSDDPMIELFASISARSPDLDELYWLSDSKRSAKLQ